MDLFESESHLESSSFDEILDFENEEHCIEHEEYDTTSEEESFYRSLDEY